MNTGPGSANGGLADQPSVKSPKSFVLDVQGTAIHAAIRISDSNVRTALKVSVVRSTSTLVTKVLVTG